MRLTTWCEVCYCSDECERWRNVVRCERVMRCWRGDGPLVSTTTVYLHWHPVNGQCSRHGDVDNSQLSTDTWQYVIHTVTHTHTHTHTHTPSLYTYSAQSTAVSLSLCLSVCCMARNVMWVSALLFRRFTDTNVYATMCPLKYGKFATKYQSMQNVEIRVVWG